MQSDTKEKENLNEEVIFKAYSKNDRYSGYAEEEKNPATMFDLTKYGKTYAYIRTHVDTLNKTSTELSIDSMSQFNYEFNQNDVDVFEATEYVHATLDDSLDRTDEEVSLTSGEKQELYSVKRGKSVLYDSFRIWRELSLLENAVLLNRLTRSSIVRTVSVEVGDMEKNSVKGLLARIKNLIEQKSAISVGNSIREYTNPGPMENVIYVPTHDGKGTISTSQIGGDAGVSDNSLGDLEYWKTKLFSALGIPKQYLGCFRGDTKILLLNGEKLPISELYENKDNYIGKGIMACNEDGSLEPTTITNIMLTKPSTDFLRIWLDNGEYVDVTPDHRMMLRDGTFIFAEDLDIGDSLMPYYDKIVEGRRYVLDNKQGKYKPQYRVVAESIYDLPKGCGLQVHHHDHKKINDDFDNLIPLTIAEHYNEHKAELSKSASEGLVRKYGGPFNTNKSIANDGIEQHYFENDADLPDGYAWGGLPRSEECRKHISDATKGVPKAYKTRAFTKSDIEKGAATKAKRQALGLYDETNKESRRKYREWAANNRDVLSNIQKNRHPENRRTRECYVRCLGCGKIEKIECNGDWYNEYMHEDRFWFCCKDCAKINGHGKLNRSYKLLKDVADFDYDEYDRLRWSREYGRPDTYFKGDTLKEIVTNYIDNYVPECNHKVVKIEHIDVAEPAYDITVAADCHTLALPCGIFVHNSTEDSTGFNGGTSLSLISSRYAKTIKRIQSAYLQAIETAVNLILLDKGLGSYIGKFTLKMQAPTTQEEKDRKDNINQTISNCQSILSMVNDQIQDEKARLQVLKATIAQVTSDQDIIQVIQNQIDILEQSGSEDTQDNYQDDGSSESFEFPDMGSEEELPFNDTEAEEEQTVDLSSNESFYTNKDGELLVENNLPSFEDLGIDYTTK